MEKFKRLIQGWRNRNRRGGGDTTPVSDALRDLLKVVEGTQEVEYSCDEVYALLDQYVEAVERDEDMALLMPLVKRHLEICGDCNEEFEALLKIVQNAPAI